MEEPFLFSLPPLWITAPSLSAHATCGFSYYSFAPSGFILYWRSIHLPDSDSFNLCCDICKSSTSHSLGRNSTHACIIVWFFETNHILTAYRDITPYPNTILLSFLRISQYSDTSIYVNIVIHNRLLKNRN